MLRVRGTHEQQIILCEQPALSDIAHNMKAIVIFVLVMILNGNHKAVSVLIVSLEYIGSILQ